MELKTALLTTMRRGTKWSFTSHPSDLSSMSRHHRFRSRPSAICSRCDQLTLDVQQPPCRACFPSPSSPDPVAALQADLRLPQDVHNNTTITAIIQKRETLRTRARVWGSPCITAVTVMFPGSNRTKKIFLHTGRNRVP